MAVKSLLVITHFPLSLLLLLRLLPQGAKYFVLCAKFSLRGVHPFNVDIDFINACTHCRYNDYQQDPFSACNCTPPYSPVYTIAARYDLLAENGHYDEEDLTRKAVGAIDVKVADLRSLRDFR